MHHVSDHKGSLSDRNLAFLEGPNGERATQVAAWSVKKSRWRCLDAACGHEFFAVPATVVRNSGCPFCAGQKLCPAEKLCPLCLPKSIFVRSTELKARCIEFVRGPKDEAASEMFPQTNKKVTWRCLKEGCGHTFEMAGAHVFGWQQSKCPFCTRRALCGRAECDSCTAKSVRSRAKWLEERCIQFVESPYGPDFRTPASTNKKCQWRCLRPECGHVFLCSANAITGCGYCNNKRLCSPADTCSVCLAKTVASLSDALAARQIRFLHGPNGEPSMQVFSGSSKTSFWHCLRCDIKFPSIVSNITTRPGSSGCPQCINRAETFVRKELQEAFPEAHVSVGTVGFAWCGRMRFDILVEWERRGAIIVEVDGRQHFQVAQFGSRTTDPQLQIETDVLKTQKALVHGYPVVRIPTDQIPGGAWKEELRNAIIEAQQALHEPRVIICDALYPGRYDRYKKLLGIEV